MYSGKSSEIFFSPKSQSSPMNAQSQMQTNSYYWQSGKITCDTWQTTAMFCTAFCQDSGKQTKLALVYLILAAQYCYKYRQTSQNYAFSCLS
jgi:hypothetical protein